MSLTSSAPDITQLDVPVDAWTKPFWDATAQGRLLFPRCTNCDRFRWPPGPFCPSCQSQDVQWVAPGPARLYSYTIITIRGDEENQQPRFIVPSLVEFSGVDHVRLLGALVDAPLDAIQIGMALTVGWSWSADTNIPIFHLA
jgi:uncharacterized OB-fold protein